MSLTATFDTGSLANYTTALTQTATLVVTATFAVQPSRFAVCHIRCGTAGRQNVTVSAVTYAGLSMSQMAVQSLSTTYVAYLYGLVNPPTGTGTGIIALNSNTSWAGEAVFGMIYNVNQTTPWTTLRANSGSAAAVTLTASTSINDLIFLALSSAGGGGDNSMTAVGATQLFTVSSTIGRNEFHTRTPAGTTLTAALVMPASILHVGWLVNFKGDDTGPGGAYGHLAQLGVGQ